MRTLVIALLAVSAFGQGVPRFEVASVKPASGDVFSTRPQLSKGRLRWTTQLAYLIGYAYRLDFSTVSCRQCPSIYIIEATFDPSAGDNQVRGMVQGLLAERFKLRAHRVTTEVDGYALIASSGGAKLREDSASEDSYVAATGPAPGVTLITGRRATVGQLAETLQRGAEMPVWDRTGLAGEYAFTFRYASRLNGDFAADAHALTTALRDELGLRLVKQKGPLETIVIDHVEEPSAN